MLVLSRKNDEKITLKVPGHEDIEITIVSIESRNKVKVGIEAEDDVVILRSELMPA